MRESIDYERLWDRAMKDDTGSPLALHGPIHWQRVEQNGLFLMYGNGLAITEEPIIRLFAIYHDSQRWDDGADLRHGERAYHRLHARRGIDFELSNDRFERLAHAVRFHTEEIFNDDPAIQCCYDADRLDLWRVGVVPDPKLLNTDLAKKIAGKQARRL